MADRIGNTVTNAYVIGDTTKKYYKWVPWEQPVMTSNTMYGNLKGSSQHAVSKVGTRYYYRMFDKNTSTTDGRINHWGPSNVVKAWWCWELPVQLKITKMTIYGENYYDGAADWHVIGQFYTDATKRTKVGEELVIDGKGQVKEIVIPDGIIVTALYFDKTGGGAYGGIEQIDIEATTPVEVAPGEDYDFTTSNTVIKMPTYKPKRRYFQRVFRPWNYTPALTSNTSDPNFIVSASSQLSGDYPVWKSFAASKNLAYPWFSADGKPTGWYQIKTRDKIALKYIRTQNRNTSPGFMKNFYIEGSNDGEHWIQLTPIWQNTENAASAFIDIPVGSTEAYHYHRFTILSSYRSDIVSIGFPTLIAEEEYSKREVSVDDDWDFYEDYDSVHHATTYTQERYFKRGTEPNLRLRGTPNIVDGIFSDITAATAALLPRNSYHPGAQEWEWGFKVTTGSDIANQHFILQAAKGFTEATRFGTRIYVQNNCFVLSVSYNGTAWDYLYESAPADVSAFLIQTNTTYWLKLHHKDGIYTLYVSEDGKHYVQYHKAYLGKYMYNDNTAWVLGAYNNGSYINTWNGSIDLKEAYIKFGDEIVWRGTHPVECSEEEAEWSELINIDKPIN